MDIFDTGYLDPPAELRLRSGKDDSIEDEANRLLAHSREGITALSEKRDFLSPDQLALRSAREVGNRNGFSDESLMSGMFRRAYNPLFGQRPGKISHGHDQG
jgi:AraC-like DNA-binding protein